MSRYGSRSVPNGCKVYIGDLPKDASEKELERAFSYYGALRSVWVARNPPGFAFVEFEDSRDADDSVKELDGTNICGCRVRVELSSGKVRPKPWMRGGGDRGYGGGYGDRDRGYGGGSRRSGGSRRRSYSRSYSRSRSRSRGRKDSRDRSPAARQRSRSGSNSN